MIIVYFTYKAIKRGTFSLSVISVREISRSTQNVVESEFGRTVLQGATKYRLIRLKIETVTRGKNGIYGSY